MASSNTNTTARYLKLRCGDHMAIERCANVVKKGGIIIYPTDTVYGIGCDPFNDRAVERIFFLKRRTAEKALPILAASLSDLKDVVEVSEKVERLAKSFWPGPLTIICPLATSKISSRLTANKSSLAVRIPGNPCTLALLKSTRYLVGTSANISGHVSVKSPSQIDSTSLANFDALLDGGDLDRYSHSTIISLGDGEETLTIIRSGPILERDIAAVLKIPG